MRVLGVGVGTFILIITLIASVSICLAGKGTPNRKLFAFVGTALFGLVVLILATAPRESEEDDDPQITTRIVAGRITMIVVMFLTTALAIVGWVLFQAADKITAYTLYD